MAVWRVEFEKNALRDFERLGRPDQHRVRSFLDERLLPMANPRTLGKPLSGPLAGIWRYRVGDIRILARIEDDVMVILVVTVANRREVYR